MLKAIIGSVCFLALMSLTQQDTNQVNDKELLVEVINRDTKKKLDEVTVYLYEMPSKKLMATQVTKNGKTTFPIDFGQAYEVRACKKYYTKGGISIFDCNPQGKLFCITGASNYNYEPKNETDKYNSRLRATVSLDSIMVGKTFNLENVLYDLDKWFLRSESKKELEKVYSLMTQYPYMTIEMSSHTDCRGSNEYNRALSQRRADSCKKYLVSKGISSKRIISKGYGETKLLNECADKVECTEEQHQINRRTEMEILTLPMEEYECEAGL
ncbi:MAG: OmpA family protein [Crocinitomicaceae bacterium]